MQTIFKRAHLARHILCGRRRGQPDCSEIAVGFSPRLLCMNSTVDETFFWLVSACGGVCEAEIMLWDLSLWQD